MSIEQLLLTIISISAFCLGFRTITDDGMILHFLRKPFLYFQNQLKEINESLEKESNILKAFKSGGANVMKVEEIKWTIDCLKYEYFFCNACVYALKPIIGCCACFASVWGLFVFYSLNGLSTHLWKEIIICCTSASFINYFCWTYLEKKL
jgi:hypothetical protein